MPTKTASKPKKSNAKTTVDLTRKVERLEARVVELEKQCAIHIDVIHSLADEVFCSWGWPNDEEVSAH